MDGKLREIIESKKYDREVAEFAGITLTLAEYDFLIEQAELVEELKKQSHGIELNLLNDEVVRLEKKNQRYKQALEFYAEERNYKERDFGIIVQPAIQEGDRGNTARKALEANE